MNSFLASRHFCPLLITFARSLDPDQDRHSVGPDLVPNPLTLLVFPSFKKVNFEKKSADHKSKACKIIHHATSQVKSSFHLECMQQIILFMTKILAGIEIKL